MCVKVRGVARREGAGAEEMEWGSYYLGNIFEEGRARLDDLGMGPPCSCCPL